ncbi:MAG TPA: MarP family serine protease, partial [Candidatus Saccharimonadales bacterium]
SVWLLASVLSTLPSMNMRTELQSSRIIKFLNQQLPAAPTLIADLGRLIDPNGFPQVFIGSEPSPPSNVTSPNLGSIQPAVARDRASVVKVEGQGCGGVVEGSGFVVATNEIATNAHVVAGIRQPYVQDGNGLHRAAVIWFDSNLDFAVLRVSNLAGPKLPIASGHVEQGTAAAVMGYPGGGPFTAGGATVLDEFMATGRDIYGHGATNRNVYELQASIIPGNSGGPLVNEAGSVIGVVFAESTTYQHVGYALTTDKVISSIDQATARNQPADTGQCAE